MGGRLTGLVAGSDQRVSTASPSVGGSGFLQSDLWGSLIRQEEFVVIWASSKEQSQDKFFYQEYVVQFSTSVPPMTLMPLWILLKKGCHSYPTTISAQSMPHILIIVSLPRLKSHAPFGLIASSAASEFPSSPTAELSLIKLLV